MKSRGNDPQVIDRLLEDALLWVQVEEIANEQKNDLSELNALFIMEGQWRPTDRKVPLWDENRYEVETWKSFGAAVGEFCGYLTAGVKTLRDTSQELIGLVSQVKVSNQVSSN